MREKHTLHAKLADDAAESILWTFEYSPLDSNTLHPPSKKYSLHFKAAGFK